MISYFYCIIGDFSYASVSLGLNKLARFESSVFRLMLRQMAAARQNGSQLILTSSKIRQEAYIACMKWSYYFSLT